MKKPLIGISCSFNSKESQYAMGVTYVESVKKAGGIPVMLTFVEGDDVHELLEHLDGVLFSGGPDMDPSFFGEEPHQRLGGISPERDAFEVEACREAMAMGLPILGICRGCQLINVVAGGNLVQDIPAQVPGAIKHGQDAPRWHASHTARIRPGTKLASILESDKISVNSYHHQSVKDVAPNWLVSAVAADGVIEAIEDPNQPFCLGIQWHPECFYEYTAFDALFRAFVEACRE
ncbi:MAG: gamma-glutamyl-gamma-aminobutyrate hydrolase family protein [Bacillota bacterium]